MKKAKKILATVLCVSTAVTMLTGNSVTVASDISVELEGKPITFDVNPCIVDGRTMVPLRKIFEEIGALVKWDADTQTVTARKNSKTVTLSIGSAEMTVDKGDTDSEGNPVLTTVTLDVPAQIVSGRTLVPARAVSESFGLDVDWDEDSRRVIISSDEEEDDSWKENKGTIDLSELSFTGDGIEIDDKVITITKGGDFTLSGTLKNGSITVDTEEKVKLRLSGVSVTAEGDPCIFIKNADKAYITLTDSTENTLVAENSEDGAIYSKDNLEIKGKGTLNITSKVGHGIKSTDNLTIENGSITIDAEADGIHVNDTFKMTGGTLNIEAVGDGIASESIVSISDGAIYIETNGVPKESETSENNTEASDQNEPWRGMPGETAKVEFEKSSKGIKAEWMMCISGGEITVNSASHAIHCADEIQIDGGKFALSSEYEKGISAHGNLTVSGEDTSIDISKSTEGIESKNILTVNDGTIKVVSSDDAINATGGNSGSMGMPGGNGGGPGGNRGGHGESGVGEPPEMNGDISAERHDMPNNGEQPPEMPSDMSSEQPPEGRGRGGRGQFGGMRPTEDMPEKGDFAPPSENGEAGGFAAPPTDNGNAEAGNFAPPQGDGEKDGFIPPSENGEAGAPADGKMPPRNENSGMHGGRGSMKDCLVINGGYLELYAEDDCLDSNGNLVINGGTIKASNPNGTFAGAFAVIDPDGQTTISENATLIFAAGSGDERSLNLSQNTIIVYCEETHGANEEITVKNSKGKVIYEYAPLGKFGAVLISSNELEQGGKYTVAIGNELYETELSEQITTLGTKASGGFGGGNRGGNGGFKTDKNM